MKQFLLVYDTSRAKLIELRQFGPLERDLALSALFEREALEADNPSIEVVLLSAESRDAIEHTHARYFRTFDELAASAG